MKCVQFPQNAPLWDLFNACRCPYFHFSFLFSNRRSHGMKNWPQVIMQVMHSLDLSLLKGYVRSKNRVKNRVCLILKRSQVQCFKIKLRSKTVAMRRRRCYCYYSIQLSIFYMTTVLLGTHIWIRFARTCSRSRNSVFIRRSEPGCGLGHMKHLCITYEVCIFQFH